MSESDAKDLILSHAFSSEHVGRIGAELEWLTLPAGDPGRRATVGELAAVSRADGPPLPAGGRISWEPGGQVELSTRPATSLRGCVEGASADLVALRARSGAAGLTLLGAGLDRRPPRLVTAYPRHLALQRYYGRYGPLGRVLLCNTASVQINVDAGDDSEGWRGRRRRWTLANALGPTLMAMFANSPLPAPDGGAAHEPAVCGRQLTRFLTDGVRSGPLPSATDPRPVWLRYALDTCVVAIHDPASGGWRTPEHGLTLRQWLRGGGPRPVRARDVVHHLKSLAPPVRARGHLELRMIDAQCGDDWVVPVAIVAALLDDARTSDAAIGLLRPSGGGPVRSPGRGAWTHAALHGLADASLAMTAKSVIGMAVAGLRRLDAPGEVTEAVERFAARYTLRRRSPAGPGRVPARYTTAA